MPRIHGIGIIGAGNISAAYLRLAPLFAGLEVRAIADITPEAAKTRAEEFKLRACPPEEMFKSDDIDVIVNLTTPSAHYQVSMDSLSAGKHVYSEKPFVLTLEEGRSLKAAAEARGLHLGSAPDTFLGGSQQLARDLVDAGRVGRIASGTAHVMGRGMEHWHPNPEFFFKPGAGPILDMGPYYAAGLIQLIGPARRVAAFAGTARATREVSADGPFKGAVIQVETPTTIHGVIEFQSGAIVSLGASWDVCGHGHNPIELYGEEGTLYLPDPNFFGGDVAIADRGGAKSKIEAWDHPFGKANVTDNSGNVRANYRMVGLADMVAAIESGTPARCGIDFALHTVDLLTSLLEAGQTREVVTLATTCDRPAALRPEDARALLAYAVD